MKPFLIWTPVENDGDDNCRGDTRPVEKELLRTGREFFRVLQNPLIDDFAEGIDIDLG